MVRLGTYTTIDAPTDKQEEALAFLRERFEEIDGRVRLVNNPHDFGSYPSFEVDYPSELEDIDDEDELVEGLGFLTLKDEFHEKANEVEEEYSEKFAEWL